MMKQITLKELEDKPTQTKTKEKYLRQNRVYKNKKE